MLYEVITEPGSPGPSPFRPARRGFRGKGEDGRNIRCRPQRRPLPEGLRSPCRRARHTGNRPRITSYNVCYTKLLRILVVDRSLEPRDGAIVIAALDGELTVKRLRVRNRGLFLVPDNPDYPPIPVGPEADLTIWA